MRIKNSEQILDEINPIIDALRQAAKSSAIEHAWFAVIEVIELFTSESVTDEEYKKALGLLEGDVASEPIQFLVHSLLSLRADARLVQATASHVGVLRVLESDRAALGDVVDAYMAVVIDFWESTFERTRFRFSSPRLVAQEITDASSEILPNRVRRVLTAIASSLALRLKKEDQEWLRVQSETE